MEILIAEEVMPASIVLGKSRTSKGNETMMLRGFAIGALKNSQAVVPLLEPSKRAYTQADLLQEDHVP